MLTRKWRCFTALNPMKIILMPYIYALVKIQRTWKKSITAMDIVLLV